MNSPQLIIDLNAIQQNYLSYRNFITPKTEIAPVLKANAYGLGAGKIADVLYKLGANTFYVATLKEGVSLRKKMGNSCKIYVLNGFFLTQTHLFETYQLSAVLNDWSQVKQWCFQKQTHHLSDPLTAALHFDTGINRLGLSIEDLPKFENISACLMDKIDLVMSHLACASSLRHPMNQQQLIRFNAIAHSELFKNKRKSFVNSAGTLIGSDYHFDQIRLGIGLYGGHASSVQNTLNLTPPIIIKVPVLQIKSVKKGESIGYDASYQLHSDKQIALIGIGYADGLLRSGSNRAFARFQGHLLPVLGKISMDLTALDSTEIATKLNVGDMITLLGKELDSFSHSCQTTSYEILTRLGNRFKKIYKT